MAKVQAHHAERMRFAITPLDTNELRQKYIDAGHSAKRYRWDLTYESNLSVWLSENVYTYANDSNIDTVLRQITNTGNGPLALKPEKIESRLDKLSSMHYEEISDGVFQEDIDAVRQVYINAGLSAKQYRWDLMQRCISFEYLQKSVLPKYTMEAIDRSLQQMTQTDDGPLKLKSAYKKPKPPLTKNEVLDLIIENAIQVLWIDQHSKGTTHCVRVSTGDPNSIAISVGYEKIAGSAEKALADAVQQLVDSLTNKFNY